MCIRDSTQVQRKQTKKGAFWAIIDVEDLDASMQVLIFPKVYETCPVSDTHLDVYKRHSTSMPRWPTRWR